MPNAMSLGSIIRERREQLGLTQDRLAVAIGISKPYLSNIETGKVKNPPSDDILRGLEIALGFNKAELTRLANLARTPIDVLGEQELLEAQVQKLRGILKQLMDQGLARHGGAVDLDSLAKEVLGESAPPSLPAGVAVPVINQVSMGYPRHFNDLNYPASVAEEYVRCVNLHDSQAFAVRVAGDDMEPDYRQGDIVVFSPNSPAQSGDDCFVRFEPDAQTTFKRFYRDDEDTIRLQPLNHRYPAMVFKRQLITGIWPAVNKIQAIRRA